MQPHSNPQNSQAAGKLTVAAITKYAATMGLGAIIMLVILSLMKQTQPAPLIIEPPHPTATSPLTATPAPIQVYVSGAIHNPDVYTLAHNSILRDVIEAAGGFTDNAAVQRINLAQPLAHGMHITVPEEAEAASVRPNTNVLTSAPIVSDPVTADTPLIDLNTATQQELETLPGVGPSTAQRIVDYRTAHGRFKTVEDLLNVSGIGPAKFANLQPHVVVR